MKHIISLKIEEDIGTEVMSEILETILREKQFKKWSFVLTTREETIRKNEGIL